MSTPQTVGQGMSAAAIEQIRQKLGLNLQTLLTATKAAATYQKTTALTTTTLPTSPSNGDQFSYLATASGSANALWIFNYNTADAYWYLTGGQPLAVTVAGPLNTSGGTTYTTTGATITVPFTGDYQARADCFVYANNSGSSADSRMSVFVNGSAFGPEGFENGPSGTGGELHTVTDPTSVTAGQAVDVRYKSAVANVNITFTNFRLELLPKRIH